MTAMLRITPSETERIAGVLSGKTIEDASRHLRVDGALILEDVVDPALIGQARQAFCERYGHYLDGNKHEDALTVGERRLMITVDLEPPFDQPQLFANAWLLPILEAALDEDFLVGGFGVVCSLSTAPTQHCHRDGGILFPHSGLNWLLPVAALTVAIPLLEMNDLHGTTALWLGSHRGQSLASTEGIEPVVREGSCVLWDYRLLHGGTPNRSTVPRPLLYLTYCRPWFVDHCNYRRQAPIHASRLFVSALSEHHQRLLARAQER
jgi:hypothetical protein